MFAIKLKNHYCAGNLQKFLTEDRRYLVLVLIILVVTATHAYGWLCLQQMPKSNPSSTPFIMEASIIPVSIAKPWVAPPPPPPAEKQHPQKVPHRTKIKAASPVVPNRSESAQIMQAAEISPVAPMMPESLAITASDSESPTKTIEHTTEVTIDTHYSDNPKPMYPREALRQGWQGQVMLRVKVNEAGVSEVVNIERSSGYEILDNSAVEAVKQWRFNPAKRGDTAIASSVVVPVIFMIDDQAQIT